MQSSAHRMPGNFQQRTRDVDSVLTSAHAQIIYHTSPPSHLFKSNHIIPRLLLTCFVTYLSPQTHVRILFGCRCLSAVLVGCVCACACVRARVAGMFEQDCNDSTDAKPNTIPCRNELVRPGPLDLVLYESLPHRHVSNSRILVGCYFADPLQ